MMLEFITFILGGPKILNYVHVGENPIDHVLNCLDIGLQYFRRYEKRNLIFLNVPKIVHWIGYVGVSSIDFHVGGSRSWNLNHSEGNSL